MVNFNAALHSHQGLIRETNEDSAMASSDQLVIADGMGGHAAGEVASALAVRIVSGLASDVADLACDIQEAARSTREALQAMSQADDSLETLGTTLITVSLRGQECVVGHIGDSRAYLLRGDQLQQLTRDHTHVQRLVDSGQLSPERARAHPYRSMLLRSLDDQANGPNLDVFSVEIRDGDRLMLCSDGLSDYVDDDVIAERLAEGTPVDAAQRLVTTALHHFTRDNVTVVVADISKDDPQECAPDPCYGGAVLDGVAISDEALAALRRRWPELHFDPHSPYRPLSVDTNELVEVGPDGAPAGSESLADLTDEQLRTIPTNDPRLMETIPRYRPSLGMARSTPGPRWPLRLAVGISVGVAVGWVAIAAVMGQ